MILSQKNSFLFSCVVFIFDRITKYFALVHQWREHSITSFFSFDLVFNRGVTAGFLNFQVDWEYILLSILILCITIGLVWYTYIRIKQNKCVFGEMLALSGAFSNLIDRIYYPGVIDFIHFHAGQWSFPIFNIADVCIVIGVACMFIEQLREN